MAASDLHALQAVLLLPSERLGKVRRRAISRIPIPALLGSLLSKNKAGQLVVQPRLTHKQWECCLRSSRNHGRHRRLPHGSRIAPSSYPSEAVWSSTWPTSSSARGPRESGVSCSGRHDMGLSEFPDSLLPVILHFSGNIGDGSLCSGISLIHHRRCRFSYFAFW